MMIIGSSKKSSYYRGSKAMTLSFLLISCGPFSTKNSKDDFLSQELTKTGPIDFLDLDQELSDGFRQAFNEDSSYGYFCGFAVTPPQPRLVFAELYSKKKWKAFRYALHLGSTYARVYAAEYLLTIEYHDKIPLSELDQQTIETLSLSREEIMVCEGCILHHKSIKTILLPVTRQRLIKDVLNFDQWLKKGDTFNSEIKWEEYVD